MNVKRAVPGLVLAFVVAAGVWAWLGRPQSVPEPPPGKIDCVSYTPFRGSDTPFDPDYMADPRKIDEDIALVSGFARCIRLYAPDQGIDAAIPAAAKHGLAVLLGVWIGSDPIANEKQISRGVSLTKEYPGTIRAVVVGNEVLLRGEQTAETLAALVRRVKAETGLPVTYADVTDFWLTAPRLLADAVDFVTIHILPYWEDNPVAAEQGLATVESAVARVHARFPDKPLFIGETGFPSEGRMRETAIPSLVSEARYLRGFADYAAAANLDYNLIEAFDQPWKRDLEGAVGGYWGLYNSARVPKFPWRGPVSNHPDWPRAAAASVAFAGLAFLVWLTAGVVTTLGRAAFLGIVAGAGGVLLVLQAEHSLAAWLTVPDLAAEILLFVQSCAAFALLPPAIATGQGEIASVSACLGWLRRPRLPVDSALALGLIRFTVTTTASVVSLCLAFDPRYRDFPNAAFLFPAACFAWIAVARGEAFRPAPEYREEAMLAALLAICGAIIFVNETPLNLAADLWCLIAGLLILPWSGALGAQLSPGQAAAA